MDQNITQAMTIIRNALRQFRGTADEHDMIANAYGTTWNALQPVTGIGQDANAAETKSHVPTLKRKAKVTPMGAGAESTQ